MDAQSFLAACAPSYSRLCRFAYRYTRRRASAERAVRAALVSVWRERGSAGIDVATLDDLLHAAVRAAATERMSGSLVEQRDLEAAFQYAIDDLPARTRGVLRDRLIDGRDLSEIAAAMRNGHSPRAN